ncbi:YidH family protein [Planococcus sp. 1R117A]|uniref:YidH family protein n=1 Tax=Planococcus sp. 1R117A TaxID=3447020 RepID=UPI003EDBC46B
MENENKKKEYEENQLKFAQQHMANERTYLAWLRTAIAIIGIGFLTVSLHLTIGKSHRISDFLAILLTILSSVAGFGVIINAAVQYFRKRKQIQEQRFHSTHVSILVGLLALLIVLLVAVMYIFVQFMHIEENL